MLVAVNYQKSRATPPVISRVLLKCCPKSFSESLSPRKQETISTESLKVRKNRTPAENFFEPYGDMSQARSIKSPDLNILSVQNSKQENSTRFPPYRNKKFLGKVSTIKLSSKISHSRSEGCVRYKVYQNN